MNQCPYCGQPMFMTWINGYVVTLCPRRFDGHHPVVTVTTSDSTAPPPRR